MKYSLQRIALLADTKRHIWLRTAAAVALDKIGDKRAIDALQNAARDPDVGGLATQALNKIQGKTNN